MMVMVFVLIMSLAGIKCIFQHFRFQPHLVTNEEYLKFMKAGGYTDFRYWHAEGWDWVKTNKIQSPMYWHFIDDQWHHFTFEGLQPVD